MDSYCWILLLIEYYMVLYNFFLFCYVLQFLLISYLIFLFAIILFIIIYELWLWNKNKIWMVKFYFILYKVQKSGLPVLILKPLFVLIILVRMHEFTYYGSKLVFPVRKSPSRSWQVISRLFSLSARLSAGSLISNH